MNFEELKDFLNDRDQVGELPEVWVVDIFQKAGELSVSAGESKVQLHHLLEALLTSNDSRVRWRLTYIPDYPNLVSRMHPDSKANINRLEHVRSALCEAIAKTKPETRIPVVNFDDIDFPRNLTEMFIDAKSQTQRIKTPELFLYYLRIGSEIAVRDAHPSRGHFHWRRKSADRNAESLTTGQILQNAGLTISEIKDAAGKVAFTQPRYIKRVKPDYERVDIVGGKVVGLVQDTAAADHVEVLGITLPLPTDS